MKRIALYALLTAIVLLSSSAASVAQEVTLKSSGTSIIKGKVKEQGGRMLEGVVVVARRVEETEQPQSSNRASSRAVKIASQTKERLETKTNNKGEYIFSNLVAGDYIMTFDKPGYTSLNTWRQPLKAGETLNFKTTEMPRDREMTSIIRGAVFDINGYLMKEGVSIRIERTDGGGRYKRETNANEGGEFAFRVPSEHGVYRITAEARGFQKLTQDIEIEAAEIRQISLRLERNN
jgi:hypothetical protein